jgi:hypothetical protein
MLCHDIDVDRCDTEQRHDTPCRAMQCYMLRVRQENRNILRWSESSACSCKITHFVFLHINNWLCLRSSTSQVETDSLMENIGNVLLKLQNEQKFIYMLIVDHVCVRCSVGI